MKKLVLGAALLAPLSVLAAAAVPLDPVVVTATGAPVPQSQTLANTLVISRDEIEQSQASDVAELLQAYAGLDVERSGGIGQLAYVRIRGGETDHTLLLIDGVRLNPATGGPTLQNLSPDLIERIEILKGPRSTLYGPDAMSGVIHIITRRAEKSGVSGRIGVGRDNTLSGNAEFNHADSEKQLGLNVEQTKSDGIPPCAGDTLDRGYQRTSVQLNGQLQAGDVTLAGRAFDTSGNARYMDYCGFGNSPLDQDFRQQSVAVDASLRPTENWQTQLAFSRVVDDLQQTLGADFVRTTRPQIDWRNTLDLGPHSLGFGASAAREKADILSFGTPIAEDRDIYSVHLQDDLNIGRHHALLGLAYADHDGYGSSSTWNAEYGFDLFTQTRLILAAGTGFRAPNAFERFPGYGGNPNLDAEESRNLEAGLRQRIGRTHHIDLRVFRTDTDDLIAYVGGTAQNIKQFRNEGIDLSYRWRTEHWAATLTGLLQDPVDRSADQPLQRRARRSLGARLERQLGPHSVAVSMQSTSGRPDTNFSTFPSAPVTVPGYALLNLYGTLQLSPNWQLQARADNLLDKRYETAFGYNQPGAGFFLSLRYAP